MEDDALKHGDREDHPINPPPTPEDWEALGVEFTKAELEPIDLPGEEPDKGFRTPDGRRWRARVRKTDSRVAKSPNPDAGDAILPTSFTLTVTVAELETDNTVRKVAGRLVVSEPHEVLVSEIQLKNPGFDLARTLDRVVSMKVAELQTIGDRRDHAAEVAGEWGVDLLA